MWLSDYVCDETKQWLERREFDVLILDYWPDIGWDILYQIGEQLGAELNTNWDWDHWTEVEYD